MARKPTRSVALAQPRQRGKSSATRDRRRLHGAARREAVRGDRLRRDRRARRRVAVRAARRSSARRSRSSPRISSEIDREVLAGIDADMAEEPPRERLFDVLMRRLELLAPHKAAVRSLLRSALRNPGAGAGAQRPGGALAAMDADRRRHRRVRPEGHGARAGAGAAVRHRAAHLGRRRRSGLARTWPRSTARWRAASAGRACSTICAGFRSAPAAIAPRAAPRAARRRRAGDERIDAPERHRL